MAIEDAGVHLAGMASDHVAGKGIDAALENPKLRWGLIIGGGVLVALMLRARSGGAAAQSAGPSAQLQALAANPTNTQGANNVGAYGQMPFSDLLGLMQGGGYLSVMQNLQSDLAQINANEAAIVAAIKGTGGGAAGGGAGTGTSTGKDCRGIECARDSTMDPATCKCIPMNTVTCQCPPGWQRFGDGCGKHSFGGWDHLPCNPPPPPGAPSVVGIKALNHTARRVGI